MTDHTTPITDDDRRVAHEWAASHDPDMRCWTDRERAAARVILATVPAPPKSLADELRAWGVRPFDGLNWTRFHDLADRVESVEKENRDTTSELTRAWAERDETQHNLDEAQADLRSVRSQLDQARAELQACTAVRTSS